MTSTTALHDTLIAIGKERNGTFPGTEGMPLRTKRQWKTQIQTLEISMTYIETILQKIVSVCLTTEREKQFIE